MKKLILALMLVFVVFLVASVSAIPNPAAVYCSQMGYNYKIEKASDGGEKGVCIPASGKEFEEWAFFRGKVGKEYSYCAKKGYDLEVKKEGTSEYAVCVSKIKTMGGELTPAKNMVEMMEENKDLIIKSDVKIEPKNELKTKLKKSGVINEDVLSQIQAGNNLNPVPTGGFGAGDPPPSSFDWRTYNGETGDGWITPIKDQGQCRGCWAFSAVGAVEAKLNIDNNNASYDRDLSEQQLVSCGGGGTCNGGWNADALAYIKNTGIADEACFNYTGCKKWNTGLGICTEEYPCNLCSDWQDRVIKIFDYPGVSNTSETMKQYLVYYGPLSVSIRAGYTSFQYYTSGIFTENDTGGLDHQVVLVGYNDVEKYWIIKNSWGDWGEDGYMRLNYTNIAGEDPLARQGYIYAINSVNRHLEPYIITTSQNVSKNQFFNFSVGVRCVGIDGGECGDVSALLDPAAITCNSSPCVASSEMIKSRDNINYPNGTSAYEPNQPNTIDECADGDYWEEGWGYMVDESVENITVTSLDWDDFVGDSWVEVNTTIFCYDEGLEGGIWDIINFVYTNNSLNPNWRVVAYQDPCPGPGFQTITKKFKLDNVNGTHTVRILNQYDTDGPRGTHGDSVNSTCGVGGESWNFGYHDSDDVSITVRKGKGIIPVGSGTPFYTTSSQPQNCLNMKVNDTCNLTWQVNATGVDGLYKFFGIFSSNLPIPTVESDKVDITITEPESISITFIGDEIAFGEVTPGIEGVAQDNPYGLLVESNVNVDIYQKGTDFSTLTPNSFSITNMKWAETPEGTKASLHNTYDKILDSKSEGTYDMYYWLTVPFSVVPDSDYISDITITAVLEDTGPPSSSSPLSSTPQTTQTQQGGASVNVIKLN